jgi:hypothetical protein
VYSIGCPGEVQIGKFGRSGRLMRVNEDIVMWDGCDGNKMKLELYQAGCFLKIGVIKE